MTHTDESNVMQEQTWFNSMRTAQRELSDKISDEITGSLLNKRTFGEIRVYLGFETHKERDADPIQKEDDFCKTAIKSAVHPDVFEAVIGYTEYLGCRLVKNDLNEMPLPLDSEVPYETMSEKYGPSVPLLRDVVGRMNVQPSLPLIGRLEHGKIVPDVETMSKWKEGFDWSLTPDSSDLKGL